MTNSSIVGSLNQFILDDIYVFVVCNMDSHPKLPSDRFTGDDMFAFVHPIGMCYYVCSNQNKCTLQSCEDLSNFQSVHSDLKPSRAFLLIPKRIPLKLKSAATLFNHSGFIGQMKYKACAFACLALCVFGFHKSRFLKI